jgi:membrane protein required for colicin V production
VNLLDLLLIVMVGASVVLGFMAGFARAAIGFIAVIGGMLFGFWFYGIPAAWLHRFFSSNTVCNLLGFFVVFFGFQLAGGITGKILSKLFKWTGLSWLDRILGAGFGLVRGLLFATAFVAVLLAFTPRPVPNWMVDSAVMPYAVDASNLCASLAPRAVKDAFRASLDEIRKVWEDQVKNVEKFHKQKADKKSNLKKVEQ